MTLSEFLENEFKRRKTANGRYSLRAFARDLNINPGFLSTVLRGQRGLSTTKTRQIARQLGYDPQQTLELIALNEFRDEASPENEYTALNIDAFQVISDWYHYAILELTFCKGFKPDPEWIADRLTISVDEATKAVQRLKRLGLLSTARGSLEKTDAFIATPTDRPSPGLRSFHAQHLEKAKQALETQPIHERDITGTTFAIDPTQVEAAKKEIRKFRLRMAKLLSSKTKPTEVYHLGIQLYRLTDKESS